YLFIGPPICFAFYFQVTLLMFIPLLFVSEDNIYLKEMKRGSVVGKLAQDLGVDRNTFSSREPRIEFDGKKRYCEINAQNGALVINERIDREELCGQKPLCTLSFDLFMENPLELHRITLEIQDINDNNPAFPHSEVKLDIPESADKGSRFSIDEAADPDSGIHSVQGYRLSNNPHFSLAVQTSAETGKYAEIVLEHELDREKQDKHSLILTAYDGGNPQKSGTVVIQIRVLDINDNKPVFSQPVYKVSVPENLLVDSVVVTVSASDADEGANGDVTYEFSHMPVNAKPIFSIDPASGDITIKGSLDFEDSPSFEIRVKAKDGAGLAATSKVVVDISDVNDNAPFIVIKSLKTPLMEDATVGTEVAVIYVQDKDTESNGKFYSFIHGTESTSLTINLLISDVNDNPPVFEQQSYSAYISENNKPGTSVCSVSANDPDWRQNGTVLYSLVPSEVSGVPVSSFLSINGDTGVIHAVRSFDYEQFRNFTVKAVARDNGSPPLSTTLSGSLVSKVIAVDADSGQNAWLSYQIVKSTDPGLFSIGLHSGEIKTQRDISESDNMKQNLVISVKDNGQPSLSTPCAVNLLISDNLSEVPELKDMTYEDSNSKLTSYLIIALVSVSTFFLTFIILIVAVKFCHRRKPRLLFDGAVAVPSTYLPPNYAEVDEAGTLRSSYNYDAYLTTGSRTSDFKFVSSYNENTLPAGGTLKKEHNFQFGSSMITIDVTENEDEVREALLFCTVFLHFMVSRLIIYIFLIIFELILLSTLLRWFLFK
uniref:Cadherin domain-containing protein n=1 Tax=Sinocyclocheilus grahami TaxID=75366 RepID=A0A672TDT9_SINGR